MHLLKKYIILILLIILCSNKNYAQKIDSLLQELPKSKGINKSLIYFELAWMYKDTNYTKAIYYGEEALKIAENLKSQQEICIYNNLLGMIYLSKNRLEESQFYFLKALSIAEELNDKVKTSQILNNLGSVYHKQLNHAKALEYYLESFKIKQEIKDEKSYVPTLINIAGVYYETGDKEKAKEYFLIAEKEALRFSDKKNLGIIYGNLGILFREKDAENAISYYRKSLDIKREQKNLEGMAATELNLGALYLNQLINLDSAEKFLNSSLEKSIKLENYDRLNLLYFNLSELYYKKKDYEQSHKYAMKAYTTKDSVYSKNNAQKIAELQAKYETEKKQKQIELLEKEAKYNELEKDKSKKELELLFKEKQLVDYEKNAKEKEIELLTQQNLLSEVESEKKSQEIELLNKDKFLKESELERQKTFRNLILVALFSIALIAFFIYNRYQIKQRSNKLLESQNTEILFQKSEIENQKQVLETQHKEILESIAYAKRIQEAMLTSEVYIERNLMRLNKKA
jgi:tetratricopeptide (TPR) repeat protein